jgi:uncharacterized protein (DUF58 family)
VGPLLLPRRGLVGFASGVVLATTGAIWGVEEFVLLAIFIAIAILIGLLQVLIASRSGRARCHVFVHPSATEVAVGSSLSVEMEVVAPVAGWAALRLEDPAWSWLRLQDPQAPLPPTQSGRLWAIPSAVAILPNRATDVMSYRQQLEAGHRGLFTVTGPRLWCTDSFGLFARLLARAPSTVVSVQPVPQAPDVPLDLIGAEHSQNENTSDRAPVRRGLPDSSTDLTGLRAYVPGDRLRLLHWPTLARTGELVVRDFEPLGPHRIVIVLDTRVSVLGGDGVEAVIAAGAGLASLLLDRGSSVELWTITGERIVRTVGHGGIKVALRALAALDLYERRTRRRPRGPAPAPRAATPLTTGLLSSVAFPTTVTTALGASQLGGAPRAGRLVVVG